MKVYRELFPPFLSLCLRRPRGRPEGGALAHRLIAERNALAAGIGAACPTDRAARQPNPEDPL